MVFSERSLAHSLSVSEMAMQNTGICDCEIRNRRCSHVGLQEIKTWCAQVDALLIHGSMSRARRRQVLKRKLHLSTRQVVAFERSLRGLGSTFVVIDIWCQRQTTSDWELRGETLMGHIESFARNLSVTHLITDGVNSWQGSTLVTGRCPYTSICNKY